MPMFMDSLIVMAKASKIDMCESIKGYVVSMTLALTLEATEPSRIYSDPQIQGPHTAEKLYYTGTDVTRVIVLGSVLENLIEHLGKDSRNPPTYMATKTPLATRLPWMTSVGREAYGFARTIREFIYIMVNNPILNKNIIWDGVLVNTKNSKWSTSKNFPSYQQVHRTLLVPPRTSRSYTSADINEALRPKEAKLYI